MRRWTSLLSLSLALVATSALAQTVDNHTRATDRFVLGRTAQQQGDYKLALQLFTASQALEPGRGTLLNMAICEEKVGLLATAMQHFRELLPQFPADDDRFPVVTQHIAELGPRLPRIRIELAPSAPHDALVTLDDHPVAANALGTEIASDPGKHAISVSAGGRAIKHYDVVVEEGKLSALTVEPDAALPATTGTPSDTSTSGNRTPGFVIGGLGLAGIAVGAATGLVSLHDHSAVASACPTRRDCTQQIVDQASTGKTMSIVSTVAFAAGAVGLGLGMYFILSPSKSTTPAPKVGFAITPNSTQAEFRFAF